jgi:hypothetical protein
MILFILQHQFWAAVALYWIFSAAVSSMPEPAGGSAGYLWAYRFLHTIAGNITTALGSRIPGFKIVGPLLLAPLVFPAAACAAHYTVHPGALNVTDSAAYDTLLIAQAAIDRARVEDQSQALPAADKDALNTLIRSYNVAREAWFTYRGAITANVPADAYFQQLNKNLIDLTDAIEMLKGKGVKQ